MENSLKDLISLPRFRYEDVAVKDLKCRGSHDEKGRFTIDRVTFRDQEVAPTQRFWDSLCSRFSFGPSIFKYFSHAEVFNRISEVCENDRVSLTVQNKPGEHEFVEPSGFIPQLLAVSNPEKETVTIDDVVAILNRVGATKVRYRSGIVISHHKLYQDIDWLVGSDRHSGCFVLETPIDGYGKPNIFLTLLRQVCSNGVVAYNRAFQSGIILGSRDAAQDTIIRATQAYNNEDGFVALKDRLVSAQKSWASVHECVRFAKVIFGLSNSSFRPEMVQSSSPLKEWDLRNNLLQTLHKRSGDLRAIYGVAQIDSISEKRMRQLPSKARVYDLICLATEVATHQLRPEAARTMYGFVGSLIGNDIYDLENSCEDFVEFEDFLDEGSRAMVN